MKKPLFNCFVMGVMFCALQQNGHAQWNNDPGINNTVLELTGLRSHLTMVNDGEDGAFIFWSDGRDWPDLGQIYGQHLDGDGVAMWEPEGRAVCTAPNTQQQSQAVADGQGGTYVVWNDNRMAQGSLQRRQLYAQHYNAAGESTWADGGIYVGGLIDPNFTGVNGLLPGNIIACSDGAGGMIVTWTELYQVAGNLNGAFAQRIDIDGNLLWNGGIALPVHQESSTAGLVFITADGEGGAYITCRVSQGTTTSLRVHRVDGTGAKPWGESGVVVNSSNVQPTIVATLAQDNNLFMVWLQSGTQKLMAQLISPEGQLLWAENGGAVSDNAYENDDPVVAADAHGCYVSYCEKFDSPYCNAFSQRFNYDGSRAWGGHGSPLLSSAVRHHTTSVFADGFGGSVTTITELSITGVQPQLLHAANTRSDGLPNGEVLLLNNTAVTQSGSSKAHQVTLPMPGSQFITSWTENRSPAPQGQFNIYAARFSFDSYTVSASPSANTAGNLALYPNPAAGHFTLSYSASPGAHVRVFDLIGKTVHQQALPGALTTIDIGGWNAGVYLVVVDDAGTKVCRKLVVQ